MSKINLDYISRLATLALLYKPAEFTNAVHEEITKETTALHRNVRLWIRVPERYLGVPEPQLPTKPVQLSIPLPLTPTKGTLVDVQGLSIMSEGKQIPHSIANHDQHIAISETLLEARYRWTYLRAFEADESVRPDPSVWDALTAEGQKLPAIVSEESEKAKSIVAGLFKPGDNEAHQLRCYTGDLRPADEPRLRKLCDLLAERYLLLVLTKARIGQELEISFRYRQKYQSDAPRLRRLFGASNRWVRFHTPLAKHTNHYDFRHTVRDGYFISSQGAYEKEKKDSTPVRIETALHPPSPDRPVESIEPGGTAGSHVLITNGSRTTQYLEVGITSDEIPPGTIGYACAVLALQLFVLLLARTVVNYRELQMVDLPALVVSLVSTLPLISGVFFPRSDLSRSPLLSRAALFFGALFGNVFALWIAVATSQPRDAVGILTGWVEQLKRWADDIILVLLLTLLVVAVGRLCVVTFRFVSTMR